MSNGISPSERDFISYMRGLAILSIVFGHVGGYWAFQPYSSYLHMSGSSFFFYLSGAVLYQTYRKNNNLLYYYSRRYINLLLPYYMICLVSLVVYYVNNSALPDLDPGKILLWFTIRPTNEIMAYPVGQLWFLNTYVVLILCSPLYFYLHDNNRSTQYVLMLAIAALSFVQYLQPIDVLIGRGLYNFIFYSLFFLLGITAFSKQSVKAENFCFILGFISLVTLVVFHWKLYLPDLTDNYTRRDLISAAASISFISVVSLCRRSIQGMLSRIPPLTVILNFCHRHTFSIYLLHSLAIYLSEQIPLFANETDKGVCFGLSKFLVVLLLTCALAGPFTKISKLIGQVLLSLLPEQVGNEKVVSDPVANR